MRRTRNPRSCISCKRERLPQEMIRIVRTADDKVIIDDSGKTAGRGAYVCPEVACLLIACRKRLFEKALKTDIPAEIYEDLNSRIQVLDPTVPCKSFQLKDVLSLMGLAHRSGELFIGQDKIIERLKSQKRLLIVLTEDHSETLERTLLAREADVRIIQGLGRAELGRCLGLQEVQAVAFEPDSGFARKVGDLLPKGGIAIE